MKVWISRIIHSRTMLAFIAIDIIGVIQVNADFLSTVMKPNQFGWLILSIGIIGKVLRLITTQPLKNK